MSGNNRIILQGGGDHGRVVLDCLLDAGSHVVGIYDPAHSGSLMGVPQRGVYDPLAEPGALAIIAIGDNRVRQTVVQKTKHAFGNAIHGTAIVSRFASYGVGNMILHRSVLQAESSVGNHVIVNTGAQVDHDCAIGNFVHLAPGVILCGRVKIAEGSFVGAGAVVLPGRSIGAWATIGAGSVVTRDIPDFAVAMGNPARVVKINQHG